MVCNTHVSPYSKCDWCSRQQEARPSCLFHRTHRRPRPSSALQVTPPPPSSLPSAAPSLSLSLCSNLLNSGVPATRCLSVSSIYCHAHEERERGGDEQRGDAELQIEIASIPMPLPRRMQQACIMRQACNFRMINALPTLCLRSILRWNNKHFFSR